MGEGGYGATAGFAGLPRVSSCRWPSTPRETSGGPNRPSTAQRPRGRKTSRFGHLLGWSSACVRREIRTAPRTIHRTYRTTTVQCETVAQEKTAPSFRAEVRCSWAAARPQIRPNLVAVEVNLCKKSTPFGTGSKH